MLASPSPLKAIVLLYILLLQSFIQKTELGVYISFLEYIDEFVVLFCLPFLLKFLVGRGLGNPMITVFIFLYLIFLFISVISSILGIGGFAQFIYQFALDSKFVVVFLFCYGAYRKNITEKYFSASIKVLVLVNVPFVLLQMVLPDVYDGLFPYGLHHGKFFSADGQSYARAAGIFLFTGIFAFYMAIAVGFFAIQLFMRKRTVSNYFYLIISSVLLLTTLSRGEIMGCLISVILTYIFFVSQIKMKPVYFLFLPIGLLLFAFVNHHLVFGSLTEIGLFETVGSHDAPRAKIMFAALSEANENFPIGSGLGTFGGKAAVVYDSQLFYKHGFQYEWYFSHGLFLMDTYWPKVIAESGWLGAAFLLFVYIYHPIKYVVKSNALCFSGVFSFFSMTALLINSFSAPIYNSAIVIFIVMFICGFDNRVFLDVARQKSSV